MPRSTVNIGAFLYRVVTAAALTMLISGCETTGSAPFKPPVIFARGATLEMPPGWDDVYFARVEQGKSPAVAVVDFDRNAGIPKALDLKLEDMLITALVQTGKISVVERAKLRHVQQEQQRALQRIRPEMPIASQLSFDPETAPQLGRLVGAQGVVYGSVTSATENRTEMFTHLRRRFEVVIDVRAADTTSGRIFLSEKATGTYDAKVYTTAEGVVIKGDTDAPAAYTKAATQALETIAAKISEHYPRLGRVLEVRGDSIYLDVGEARGGKQGEQFIVFRKGSEIMQAKAAVPIGWEKQVIAAVKLVSSEREMSVARPVKLKNPEVPVQKGDFVISDSAPKR